jgi:hypothetical protein
LLDRVISIPREDSIPGVGESSSEFERRLAVGHPSLMWLEGIDVHQHIGRIDAHELFLGSDGKTPSASMTCASRPAVALLRFAALSGSISQKM